jgi:hypothetical protein
MATYAIKCNRQYINRCGSSATLVGGLSHATVFGSEGEAREAFGGLVEYIKTYILPSYAVARSVFEVVEIPAPATGPATPGDGGRNPGGRCPECGHTFGHREDCCLI